MSEIGPGQNAEALQQLRQGGVAVAGPEYPEFTTMSFIAHFVEVHVEPRTRRVRMPRGRHRRLRAGDQPAHGDEPVARRRRRELLTLREAAEIDPRWRPSRPRLLVVAVNADIGEIEVGLINQPDCGELDGIKGLGEVVLSGRRRRSSTFIMRRRRPCPARRVHIEIFCDRRRASNMAAALKP